MMKTTKLAALGIAAGLAAGGAAGAILAVPAVSGAQSTDTTTAPANSTPDGADTARPDPGSRIADALAPLVQDGTLTQEQADKVASALKDAVPDRGPGRGHGGPGKGLDAAATALGLSEDDLRSALQGGQTIAQVAQSKGVDVQTVIDAMVAEAKTHLDEEVASGEHTQAEADQILSRQTQRITDMVNNGGHAGGDHGPGGAPPADDGASSQPG